VAVGLFYFAAEPRWHDKGWGGARFIASQGNYNSKGGDTITRNSSGDDAVHAVMVTWYHWGIHGWIPYTTIGALLGLLTYRRGLPMSIRFGFYPLIGDRVYGWIGDIIDILSIVTTIMGVCTSLGMGAMSVNMGLSRLSQGFYRGVSYNVPDEPKYEWPTCAGTGNKYWPEIKTCAEKWTPREFTSVDNSTFIAQNLEFQQESYGIQANFTMQVVLIVIITLCATASTVSGLDRGIKELSRLGFAMSVLVILFFLLAGDTIFQLNLFVQTLGYYIWYLPKIAFHTDAFELLGKADMGRGGFATGGSKGWMDTWTIFYWGWWISWGPFVGSFLAKISRGRTLRSFVIGTLILPSIYGFAWFATVGGESIRMQTMAESSGLCNNWKNAAPGVCMLSDEEMDSAGNCKTGAELVDAGLLDVKPVGGAEYHCGRRACSSETLHKARCGKMLPTCSHYAAVFSTKQKKLKGYGFNPGCKLLNNGPAAPTLSGQCQKLEWAFWEQREDQCVKATKWVDVPCGSGKDPTIMNEADLACGTSMAHRNNPNVSWTNVDGSKLTEESKRRIGKQAIQQVVNNEATRYPGAPDFCQNASKDKITYDMIDKTNPARMYNLFAEGGVKPDAAAHIFDNINDPWSADEDLDMSEVWVWNNVTKRSEYKPMSCFVPAPDNQVCLWNQLKEDLIFDMIGALAHSREFNDFLTVFSLIALVIFFVTSSDSGSLIVDIMAANGHEEPPILQRIFWALTEGATAIALLYAGKYVDGPFGDIGEGGLRALQAASIVMGLPYTFVVFWMSQALVQVCREEAGELDPNRPRFEMFLFSLPRSKTVDIGSGFLMLLRNTAAPFASPAVRHACLDWPLGKLTQGWFPAVCIGLMFYEGLVDCFIGVVEYNVMMFGFSILIGFAFLISLVRREIRRQWGIPRGDFISDFLYTIFFYPFVLTQLEIQMKEEKAKKTFSV
jgi:choline-glycine betaine transporter